MGCRRRPTLPRPLGRSTIGAVGLNDRVRDGNGCGPYALVASDSVVERRSVMRERQEVDSGVGSDVVSNPYCRSLRALRGA